MKVQNPFTQEIIGEISFESEKEIEKRVVKAQQTKEKIANFSAHRRAEVLFDIVAKIKEKKEKFTQTIIEESGKPYRYALGEVNRAIETFTVAAEETKRWPHELMDLDSTKKGKNLQGEMVYFPRGIILGISPFNFPLNLVAHKVAPAIAAGCPILLKPSEKTPFTALLLEKIVATTSLPKGAFQVFHCSNELTGKLVEHPAINVFSFTGSAKVGWHLKTKAKNKHTVLELGGNAAAIVDKDADISSTVEQLVVGGFAYSGQVCIHTQRIYVHQDIMKEFTSAFVQKTRGIRKGNPKDKETEFSCLINEESVNRIENWVNEAKDAGAKCLIGGERMDVFYLPTVLTNVPKDQKVRNEEIFGPVVLIEPFKTMEEAVEEVNDSQWGLQAAIYTDSIKHRDYAFRHLKVGALIHNKATIFRVDEMPYGGIKNSGFGREGVRYAIRDFLEPKLLVRER